MRGLEQRHRARRQWPERADDFRMMRMPDQQDFAAALEMDRRLAVDLGDQRTRGIEREEIAVARVGWDRVVNPMGLVRHRVIGLVGTLRHFYDEHVTHCPQSVRPLPHL